MIKSPDTTDAVKIGSESRTTYNGERWILDGEFTNSYPGRRCHACRKPNHGEYVWVSRPKSDSTLASLWTCHACTKRLYGDFTQLSDGWGNEGAEF
jgi:hypothetical protein